MANYTDYEIPENTDENYWHTEDGGGSDGDTYAKVGYDVFLGGGIWDGALRFPSVSISSSVNSAYLRFYVGSQTRTDDIRANVYGIDEDNTATFTGAPFGRTNTTANTGQVSWAGSQGEYWNIDVTSIVNEIVGRGGWSSGNAMGFLIYDDGTSTSNTNFVSESSGGTNSVLSWRVNAAADFYPDNNDVYLTNSEVVRDVGKKISPPGVDVVDSIIEEQLYNTRRPVPKMLSKGLFSETEKHIYHNTNVAPIGILYGRDDSNGRRYAAPNFGVVSGNPTLAFRSDETEAVFIATQTDSTYYLLFSDGIDPK